MSAEQDPVADMVFPDGTRMPFATVVDSGEGWTYLKILPHLEHHPALGPARAVEHALLEWYDREKRAGGSTP